MFKLHENITNPLKYNDQIFMFIEEFLIHNLIQMFMFQRKIGVAIVRKERQVKSETNKRRKERFKKHWISQKETNNQRDRDGAGNDVVVCFDLQNSCIATGKNVNFSL